MFQVGASSPQALGGRWASSSTPGMQASLDSCSMHNPQVSRSCRLVGACTSSEKRCHWTLHRHNSQGRGRRVTATWTQKSTASESLMTAVTEDRRGEIECGSCNIKRNPGRTTAAKAATPQPNPVHSSAAFGTLDNRCGPTSSFHVFASAL